MSMKIFLNSGRLKMFIGSASNVSLTTIIIILELILLIDSVALVIQSKGKVVKIVNIILAILWVVCIIGNLINFGIH